MERRPGPGLVDRDSARHLLALIRHAEQLGQVSGVVTSAEGLLAPGRLEGLAAAGVDHLLAVVDPESAAFLSAPPGAAGTAALGIAQQALAEAGLSLVWDLPVPFASHNPIRLETGAGPEAGARLYIEPDGAVLP